MSTLNLNVVLPDEKYLGYCVGAKRGFELLKEGLKLAKEEKTVLFYETVPNEVSSIFKKLFKWWMFWIPLKKYSPELLKKYPNAIRYITPYGAKPEEYTGRLMDSTCGSVRKVFNLAKEYDALGYQVIILGDIYGWTHFVNAQIGGRGRIIQDCRELRSEKFSDKVVVICQSTFKQDMAKNEIKAMREDHPETEILDKTSFCPQYNARIAEMQRLLKECDGIVIVGRHSSCQANYLYELALRETHGERSDILWGHVYLVESVDNLFGKMFNPGHKVGIIGTNSISKKEVLKVRDGLLKLRANTKAKKEMLGCPCKFCPSRCYEKFCPCE